MKWFRRFQMAMSIGMVALNWFDRAKADGVITVDEMVEGVTELVDAAGLSDAIRIEVAVVLEVSK